MPRGKRQLALSNINGNIATRRPASVCAVSWHSRALTPASRATPKAASYASSLLKCCLVATDEVAAPAAWNQDMTVMAHCSGRGGHEAKYSTSKAEAAAAAVLSALVASAGVCYNSAASGNQAGFAPVTPGVPQQTGLACVCMCLF